MNDRNEGVGNQLPPGITLEQVQGAIDRSGYPLQVIVENLMRDSFRVQPEWGFFDRATREMRAIDLLGVRELYDPFASRKRIRPSLAVMVECKRSALPYVFFESSDKIHGNFPHFAGLRSDDIAVKTDDDRSTYTFSVNRLLGLSHEPFIETPPTCSTLSKCARTGSNLMLTGAESYHGLVLPIRSAVEHFRQAAQPVPTAHFFDAYMLIGLAVVEAPMISVSVGLGGQPTLEHTEWYRLWRHEPIPEEEFMAHRGEASAIDVVHRKFLPRYLEEHLFPFAERFAELALRHDEELATGKGFAPGLGRRPRLDIETVLEPRTVDPWISDDDVVIDGSIPRAIAKAVVEALRTRIEAMRLRRRQRRRRGTSN